MIDIVNNAKQAIIYLQQIHPVYLIAKLDCNDYILTNFIRYWNTTTSGCS